jgi:uncharacterized protein (TIGR03084 family)
VVSAELLRDLDAEQATLDALLSDLDDAVWVRPTPADGWSITDTVAHLAVSERAAHASLTIDCDPLESGAPHHSSTPSSPQEVLEEWRAARRDTLTAFAATSPSVRVPWGGRRMSTQSLATARLMETWAHGLDCFAALNAAPRDTERLWHVAWLGLRTLPYAFAVADQQPPASLDELRLELTSPSGGTWHLGPEQAPSIVRGPAGDWCRLATHRLRPPARSTLRCEGALAQSSVQVVRAFL